MNNKLFKLQIWQEEIQNKLLKLFSAYKMNLRILINNPIKIKMMKKKNYNNYLNNLNKENIFQVNLNLISQTDKKITKLEYLRKIFKKIIKFKL